MTSEPKTTDQLPIYTVTARNTAADSENKMHDDAVASEFGFRGGLVPGVTVYAYMTVPVVRHFGIDWLEGGAMKVRLLQPFYDGEPAVIRAEASGGSDHLTVKVKAERQNGELCAAAEASLSADRSNALPSPIEDVTDFGDAPAPAADERPQATSDSLRAGTIFGAVSEKLDLDSIGGSLLRKIEERLPVYYGSEAVAHPILMLSLANRILMQNRRLGPWIHASSELLNCGLAHNGETLTIKGQVHDCFERKGHEFVVLDLVIFSDHRLIQKVRHTAIYKPRRP